MSPSQRAIKSKVELDPNTPIVKPGEKRTANSAVWLLLPLLVLSFFTKTALSATPTNWEPVST
ncbi:hypothetical protein, partial [Methylomonas koyamae]